MPPPSPPPPSRPVSPDCRAIIEAISRRSTGAFLRAESAFICEQATVNVDPCARRPPRLYRSFLPSFLLSPNLFLFSFFFIIIRQPIARSAGTEFYVQAVVSLIFFSQPLVFQGKGNSISGTV